MFLSELSGVMFGARAIAMGMKDISILLGVLPGM